MHHPSPEEAGIGRRQFLQAGGFGLGCLACPDAGPWLAALQPRGEPRAQAVIQIFLQGGLSHIDSFDPKPNAPIEVRGEFKTIRSKLDGEPLGEALRHTAMVADRLAILRATTHGEAAHERGTHAMLTGYKPSPAITYPSMGTVVARRLGSRKSLPPYVCIPSASHPYLGPGYLSPAYGPFSVGGEPNARNFRVRDLRATVSPRRHARRKKLLAALDRGCKARAASVEATAAFYSQAYELMDSPQARSAFDIAAEPSKLRDRYGRTNIGQRLLLARRLVEAGARYVTVLDGGYDNHRRIFPTLRARLRAFDQGYAALIADMDASGLLDRVLVMVTSEFGRTPKVNRNSGRDHWPRVFSSVLAGGGIKRGVVHGSSTAEGAEPRSDPVGPGDLAATMFTLMGIDPQARIIAPGGRPIMIVREGRVLRELIA